MKNYPVKKILASVQPSAPNESVHAWAEKLSGGFRAPLVLYAAMEAEGNLAYSDLAGKEHNKRLKTLMSNLQELGKRMLRAYSVRYLLESDRHWHNLVQQMRDEHADLLVAAMPPAGESPSGKLSALMYNSPCPALFVREGMQPATPQKIFFPVRLKGRMEEKLPVIITLAKKYNAAVCLSAFASDTAPSSKKLRLYYLLEKIADRIRTAGVAVETEHAHGFHFGTAMLERVRQTKSDLVVLAIEPTNFASKLFTKMIGPYFLENAPVPVLSIPLPVEIPAAQRSPVRPRASLQQLAMN